MHSRYIAKSFQTLNVILWTSFILSHRIEYCINLKMNFTKNSLRLNHVKHKVFHAFWKGIRTKYSNLLLKCVFKDVGIKI